SWNRLSIQTILYTPVRKVGLSEKLLRRYFRPYQVLCRLSDVTYELQDFDPVSRRRKPKDVVHVLRMKPYHDPTKQIETEDSQSQDIAFRKRKQIPPSGTFQNENLNDIGTLSFY
ncbi:uncharacterized protein TNCT_373771, partial [Trichonephila clavata]